MVAPKNTIMVKKIVGNHDSGKYEAAIPYPECLKGPKVVFHAQCGSMLGRNAMPVANAFVADQESQN
jgi:hypothetical protein